MGRVSAEQRRKEKAVKEDLWKQRWRRARCDTEDSSTLSEDSFSDQASKYLSTLCLMV